MTAKEAATHFENQRKHCRTLHLVYILLLLITMAVLIIWGTQAAFIVLIPVLVVYFAVVRRSTKKLATDWREFCVRLFTEKNFGKVEYTYKADLEKLSLYTQHPLAPISSKGKLFARNVATGSHAGIDAMFLDSTIPVGEGKATRFLSGCWMGMSFESIMQEPVRILKDDSIPVGEGWKRCAAPEDMPKDCTFYTASGEMELPEEILGALKALLGDMRYDGVIELRPEGLFVFLPRNLINVLPPSMKQPVSARMIENLAFPEIDSAYMLALKLRK